MKKVFFSFAILAMVFMFSCTKEGKVGPAGSAGTNGTNGANGTDGTNGINGTNGTDGNANVHSYNFTVAANNWTNEGLGEYDVTLSVPAITQAILNIGAVLIYQFDGTDYLQMPYTTWVSSGVTKFYTPAIHVGGIKVWFDYSDYTDHGNPGACTMKVVVIAGQTLPSNIDKKDYNAVMAYLNNL